MIETVHPVENTVPRRPRIWLFTFFSAQCWRCNVKSWMAIAAVCWLCLAYVFCLFLSLLLCQFKNTMIWAPHPDVEERAGRQRYNDPVAKCLKMLLVSETVCTLLVSAPIHPATQTPTWKQQNPAASQCQPWDTCQNPSEGHVFATIMSCGGYSRRNIQL